jgi:type IV secretory pathway VirB10-like protein
MSDLYPDHPRLCAFTFADGRRCRTPRRPDHPYLCYFHARKEAQRLASERAAWNITYDLSGDYLAFRDVNSAIAHTISAVAYGHLKGHAATTVAYLCQSLVQSAARAEREHIRTFGEDDWTDEVCKSFNSRRPPKHLLDPTLRSDPPPPPPPPRPSQPPQLADDSFDEQDDETLLDEVDDEVEDLVENEVEGEDLVENEDSGEVEHESAEQSRYQSEEQSNEQSEEQSDDEQEPQEPDAEGKDTQEEGTEEEGTEEEGTEEEEVALGFSRVTEHGSRITLPQKIYPNPLHQ